MRGPSFGAPLFGLAAEKSVLQIVIDEALDLEVLPPLCSSLLLQGRDDAEAGRGTLDPPHGFQRVTSSMAPSRTSM
jgi:hypothetical protein